MRLAITLSVILAGCATPQERAARASDSWLCHGVVATSTLERQQAYQAELRRRGVTCTAALIAAGAAAEAARVQANNDAIAAGIAVTNATKPPPQMNCTTTTFGNVANTNCR